MAQDCTFFRNEIDPFTGKKVKITTAELLHNRWQRVSIAFSNVDDLVTMQITMTTVEPICFVIGNSGVIFLDAQGQRLELPIVPTGQNCGDYQVVGGIGFFVHHLVTPAPPEIATFIPAQVRFIGADNQITIEQFRGGGYSRQPRYSSVLIVYYNNLKIQSTHEKSNFTGQRLF